MYKAFAMCLKPVMKVPTDKKKKKERGNPYTVCLYLHFLAVLVRYVLISKYFAQKRGNLLNRGKLPPLLNSTFLL
jgi:hypothetical protein